LANPVEKRPLLFGLPAAQRKSIGRWLMVGMVALMALGIALGFWPLYAASQKLPGFCTSLPVGMSASQAQAQAQAGGYEVEMAEDGRMLIKAPRMAAQVDSGRGCELRFGETGLESSAYRSAL
jgi:hypothetical protein